VDYNFIESFVYSEPTSLDAIRSLVKRLRKSFQKSLFSI